MLNLIFAINWLAIFIATLAAFLLGGVWFTVIVAKQYAIALGRDNAPQGKPAPLFIVGPLICTLVTTITSALLIEALNVTSYADALIFGVVVGFGYHTAIMTNIAINPNFPRPFLYSAINGPYFLLSSILASLILVAFG